MKRLSKIFLFSIIGLLLFISCAPKKVDPVSQTQLMLGTVCQITLYDKSSDSDFNAAFDRINEIEHLMSIHLDDSELASVNSASGLHPVVVSAETFEVIRLALDIAELSNGAFDPTIGPLVQLWDIAGANNVPSDQEGQDRKSVV